MGRNPRSVSIPRDFARYLTTWWIHAEATGSGRQGPDILGTPGIAWELKTAGFDQLRPSAWIRQTLRTLDGDMPEVIWFPPGVAIGSPHLAVAMKPLTYEMRLLKEAGYMP